MNLSRQTLLGLGVFLGGSLMLFAMVQQIEYEPSKAEEIVQPDTSDAINTLPENMIEPAPLTVDIETEQRILAQKQKEREARVAEQEKQAQAILAQQAQAATEALQKAQQESAAYRDNAKKKQDAEEAVSESHSSQVTTPIVQPRQRPVSPRHSEITAHTNHDNTPTESASSNHRTTAVETSTQDKSTSTPRPESYKVRRGDGWIKIARQYGLSAEVLAKANNTSVNASLHAGQVLNIPSIQQAQQLQQSSSSSSRSEQAQANIGTAQNTQTPPETRKNTAPERPSKYTVKAGDGLIKLAREYNIPVDALAQANGLSTSASLRVGQTLTIPSRAQVTRLQREAVQAQRRAEAAQTAEQRLAAARRAAAQGEARGKFGVQVALADNQAKADEVAQKMKAAGYSVTTSATSRGVRVIVGPETGKPAALALKDKINADPHTGVNNAWVLYWR